MPVSLAQVPVGVNPIGMPVSSKKPVPVRIVSEVATNKVSGPDSARERKWRAEDALRDIERAKRHESDKGLMRDVKALAKEKIQDLARVAGKIK